MVSQITLSDWSLRLTVAARRFGITQSSPLHPTTSDSTAARSLPLVRPFQRERRRGVGSQGRPYGGSMENGSDKSRLSPPRPNAGAPLPACQLTRRG